MFGTLYFGQMGFSGEQEQLNPATKTGGGGWTHRGQVTIMASRRPTGLPSLPKLPKPPYLFFTESTDG